MTGEISILGETLIACLLLALGCVWLKDLLYTRVTRGSLSGRERLTTKRMTHGQYIRRSSLVSLVVLFFLYTAAWGNYYRGWARLVPCGWATSGIFVLFGLRRRWRRELTETSG